MSVLRARTVALSLAGLTLLAAAEARAATVSDRVERSLPLPRGAAVEVENANGDVVLEVVEGSEVRIVANRSARAGSRNRATELLQRLEVHAARSGEAIRIAVPEIPSQGWLGWRRNEAVGADLRVGVPLAARVVVTSRNGDVVVESAGRFASVKTVNGDILIRELRGERLEASSVNGDISVRLQRLAEGAALEVSSVNGDVQVVVPKTLGAAIDARTVNGCVGSSMSLDEGRKTRSQLVGLANGGGGQIRVRTTNGQVWVKSD